MTVLFWDIDGTLLTTGRAGMYAWNDAVRELTGHLFDLKTEIRTAGLTDYLIAVKTFEMLGLDTDLAAIEPLIRRYEELLPGSLPKRAGFVLPNVREILEHFRQRGGARSYLLTGNTRSGARAKLTYYDLLHYFHGGVFAEDICDRSTIACRALELAKHTGPVVEGKVFVIGDTPHDIECAKAIKAKTIAVATGDYTIEELRAHHPWRVFSELPPAEDFVRLLDEEPAATGRAGTGRTLSA